MPTGTATPSSPTPPGQGITVRLNPTAWTRVYQTFRSNSGTQFSIQVNYKLSPGMYTSDDPANCADITQKIQLDGFERYHSQTVKPHQFYGTLGNPSDALISSEVYDPKLQHDRRTKLPAHLSPNPRLPSKNLLSRLPARQRHGHPHRH